MDFGGSGPDDGPFSRPEDGSQGRYVQRRTVVPWTTHSLWWFVHNAISHPLIAVLPTKRTFDFHDWTSRKMHGK